MTPQLCSRCHAQLSRPPLTQRQAEILNYLQAFVAQRGYAPSFGEIARQFGIRSLATVHEHMTNLERKGYIVRRYNEARSIVLVPDLKPAA